MITGRKIATDTPTASPNPHSPPTHSFGLIWEEAAQHCLWLLEHYFRSWWWTSGAWIPIAHHTLPQGWTPGTEATWSQRRQTSPQGIRGICVFVCLFVLPQSTDLGGQGSEGGLCTTSWKTRDKPLFINLLKREYSK